jgi:hypothetical protein
MYTTTADRNRARMLAGIRADEHMITYGGRRVEFKINWSMIGWVALLVGFVVVALLLVNRADGIAESVDPCRTVLASFNGPTDHPAAVRCAALVNG